jgi:hypothetical protein
MTALLGIDCAVQPGDVGLALGELRDDIVVITRCRMANRREPPLEIAVEWLGNCDAALIALDAPLGWARALPASLIGHRAGQPMGWRADDLFRRETDNRIRERFRKRPLEVGADRISRTAVAALELLTALRERTGMPIPLAWNANEGHRFRAIEVYPAATRLAHGTASVRGSLHGLDQVIDCSGVPPESMEPEDARDAVVCTLAAGDFLLGRAEPPANLEVAQVEGWIWA